MNSEKSLSTSGEQQSTSGKEVDMSHAKCYAVMEEGSKLLEKQLEAIRKKIDAVLHMQNTLLASHAEKAENYHKEIVQLKEEYEKARREDQYRKEWCEKQKKTCDEINEEILRVLEETSNVEHEIEREKKKDKELQKLMETGESVCEKAIALNKAVGYFEQRAALKVKRTNTDGELVFIFTHINCSDNEEEFVCGIEVVEDSFVVTRCEPPVPNLKQLLKTLNETNDLQKFVIAIRKAFKEGCTSKNC